MLCCSVPPTQARGAAGMAAHAGSSGGSRFHEAWRGVRNLGCRGDQGEGLQSELVYPSSSQGGKGVHGR